jgi:hypothetical protein
MRTLIAGGIAVRAQEGAADGVLDEVLPPEPSRPRATTGGTRAELTFAPDRAPDAS